MKKSESLKRLMVLALSASSICFQVVIYGMVWYQEYADRIQVYFYRKGHWMVIGIYAILLFFFSNMYGGLKIGYLKVSEVFFSQIFATVCVNFITYFQICLLVGWWIVPIPILKMTFLDFVGVSIWTFLANLFYKSMFPPRKLLLIHGERPTGEILRKFATRKDKYHVEHCISIEEGIDAVMQAVTKFPEGVIIWDVDNLNRNKLFKFCYGRGIRMYTMPKITDIMIKGSDQVHLFDTPILLTKEYVLTVEQRLTKRVIDLICSMILLVIAAPIMLVTAIAIKLYDGGPVLYKQIRCTRYQKEFSILKFRSMKVDAEKDGVARLASKNDDRITPIGRFIRMVRVDELPQLINIIKGEMTFIGPRPERPEMISRYMEEMPEFAYRTKVKAGLAGYAQVYGKYNTTPYDKLKLDLFYIENYSTWLDIKLMLLTLKILLKPESTEGVDSEQVTALKEED